MPRYNLRNPAQDQGLGAPTDGKSNNTLQTSDLYSSAYRSSSNISRTSYTNFSQSEIRSRISEMTTYSTNSSSISSGDSSVPIDYSRISSRIPSSIDSSMFPGEVSQPRREPPRQLTFTSTTIPYEPRDRAQGTYGHEVSPNLHVAEERIQKHNERRIERREFNQPFGERTQMQLQSPLQSPALYGAQRGFAEPARRFESGRKTDRKIEEDRRWW